jgi:hypothetical protein
MTVMGEYTWAALLLVQAPSSALSVVLPARGRRFWWQHSEQQLLAAHMLRVSCMQAPSPRQESWGLQGHCLLLRAVPSMPQALLLSVHKS